MDQLFVGIGAAANPGAHELQQFTRDVERFLDFVVKDSPEFRFLWEQNPKLESMARDTLEKDVPRSAIALRDAIPGISSKAIQAHGLSGAALRFKLNVIETVARGWEKVKGGLSVRAWFKQVVDAIDALLDSLIEATGARGLIKEFKDALSALLPVQ